MAESIQARLDRAATGREIASLVALALIRERGDADAALVLLESMKGQAEPQSESELDAVPIAQQAIREVVGLGVRPR